MVHHPSPFRPCSALIEILNNPDSQITIDNVYYKFTDQEWYDTHGSGRGDFVVGLRDALAKLPPEKLHGDITKGQEIQLGDIRAVVMNDPYLLDATSVNNSSVVFKFYLNGVSILVLGDLGPEGGQLLMNEHTPAELKSDIVQMSHHGQYGVNRDVYAAINPQIALWPCPQWLWDNDNGGGIGSGDWKTLETVSDGGIGRACQLLHQGRRSDNQLNKTACRMKLTGRFYFSSSVPAGAVPSGTCGLRKRLHIEAVLVGFCIHFGNVSITVIIFLRIIRCHLCHLLFYGCYQPSICLPRNPAAVVASFVSISPNLALGSRLNKATAPIASPSQIIGAITWAVIPSRASPVRGVKFLSSFPASNTVLSLITFSSCLLIVFWSSSFFEPPATAITWSLSLMQTVSPVVCAMLPHTGMQTPSVQPSVNISLK